MASIKPKVQRKAQAEYSAKKGQIRAPLSKELREKYGKRTVSLRKGDTVEVTRGDYKGYEGKVSSVITSEVRITVEGVNSKKMDGTTIPIKISPSKVMVTKLDLSDKLRKESFKGEREKE
ncbi:MAG: 50S ribosomal protein L24 [Candidatus Verstraetearchaeota archaeon]|nr:50S ribosomal protein L24 [Candidatus Verstraetearchaeota archaeon]